MKYLLKGFVLVLSLITASCTDTIDTMIPPLSDSVEPVRIYLGLQEDDAETRLIHQEVKAGERTVIKTLWETDDIIIANPTPNSETDAYHFKLVDGQGSSRGVFECTQFPNNKNPETRYSNAWTIYFPGDKIQGEGDYLRFSYNGQVQIGNESMEHLNDFHTIRLACGDINKGYPFKKEYMNLSGNNLEESSCMKFNLKGLPKYVPTEIELSYYAPAGESSSCFSIHNRLNLWWSGDYTSDNTSTSRINLKLENFTETSEITAYMMMSNHPVSLSKGGVLRVKVKMDNGRTFYSDKTLQKNTTLNGGLVHSISCNTWTENIFDDIDGFDNPEKGVHVLHEATVSNGTDIIIMGDGFAFEHFGKGGEYENIMKKAYEDFFSVEPYKSLKKYFNVYYIYAVSEQNHDAKPYYDNLGAQNGAENGSAKTLFNTQFSPGTTSITGDNFRVLEYAMQAIRTKGGKGGTECTDEKEVISRANKSLMMVMANVKCYAGTCSMVWTKGSDFGNAYSIAYTALCNNDEQRRLTTIHEAGGHGFGKLADEYEAYLYTSFNTNVWNSLKENHEFGIYRNVNEYWGPEEEAEGWKLSYPYTSKQNVYWSELFNGYGYEESESLGIYRGANTMAHFFCRATPNSLMRNQFANDGRFFNAISRWAIWYRLMKLTSSTSASDFKSSINEFIAFDRTLSIDTQGLARNISYNPEMLPLGPPVMIEGRWEDGRLIIVE